MNSENNDSLLDHATTLVEQLRGVASELTASVAEPALASTKLEKPQSLAEAARKACSTIDGLALDAQRLQTRIVHSISNVTYGKLLEYLQEEATEFRYLATGVTETEGERRTITVRYGWYGSNTPSLDELGTREKRWVSGDAAEYDERNYQRFPNLFDAIVDGVRRSGGSQVLRDSLAAIRGVVDYKLTDDERNAFAIWIEKAATQSPSQALASAVS
jgi:hypothetical protein